MYERNIHSYTMKEQLLLSKSRVAIVGVGGGGCVISEILARTGIGYLLLIDGDSFEESNLNRQLGCTVETIGLNKAICMKERLSKINPYLKVDAVPQFLNNSNYKDLLESCDNLNIVCDTVDGYENKVFVSKCCKELEIPYVSGGLGGHNFWTATFQDTLFDTGDVLSQGKSLYANPADVFIQGGFQAQEIINFLLKRNWNMNRKILQFNHETYTLLVEDLKKKT